MDAVRNQKAATNQIEIRAYGLQRSGNHAILMWLIAQYPRAAVCFLNNVAHGDADPYRSRSEVVLPGFAQSIGISCLRNAPKELLVYSYEDDRRQMNRHDEFVTSVFDREFESHRECYLKTSKTSYDMLIIRDPFNFFASRLQKLTDLSGVQDPAWIAENWKKLARRAADMERRKDAHQIVANFNSWSADKDYRRQLSERLGGTFNDSAKQQIADFGGGSSFHPLAHKRLTVGKIVGHWSELFKPKNYLKIRYHAQRLRAPKANDLPVLERWKQFVEDETFRRILADPEILTLSEQLFGEIPETRRFVDSLS